MCSLGEGRPRGLHLCCRVISYLLLYSLNCVQAPVTSWRDHIRVIALASSAAIFEEMSQRQGRTQGGVLGVQTPPIDLSTKMHNKENITFLALLILFCSNNTDSNMI